MLYCISKKLLKELNKMYQEKKRKSTILFYQNKRDNLEQFAITWVYKCYRIINWSKLKSTYSLLQEFIQITHIFGTALEQLL